MTASEGSPSPGDHSFGARLFDLFVYAPAGLAVTVAQELPELAARGRSRLGPHLRNAQVVGRFAVHTARRQMLEQVDWLAGGRPPHAEGPVTAPAPPRDQPSLRHCGPGPAAAPGRDHAVDRSIPDYDTLSASQVVRRLDGLSADELRAVVRHETGTRGRRTIVHRAEQLLGAPPPDVGARP